MGKDKFVLLMKTDPVEAEIIREKLEGAGIPVVIQQEAIGKITGLTVDGLGEAEILVPEEFLEVAKEIISE